MRYLALFFAVLFVLFAAVQYNDPDPWFWIPIYLIPAIISFLVFRGTYPVAAMWIAAVLFLIGAIYWLPPNMSEWIGMEQEASSLQMGVPFIEEARESMGLLLVFVAMAAYLIAFYTHRRPVAR
jgi:uncharacterized membrane protein